MGRVGQGKLEVAKRKGRKEDRQERGKRKGKEELGRKEDRQERGKVGKRKGRKEERQERGKVFLPFLFPRQERGQVGKKKGRKEERQGRKEKVWRERGRYGQVEEGREGNGNVGKGELEKER